MTLKWSKCACLRAGYGAVTAVLVAEALDKGRGFSIDAQGRRARSIVEKMDLQSTAELVLSAVRRDLVS